MSNAVAKMIRPVAGTKKYAQSQWIDLIIEGIRRKINSGTPMYRIAEETGLCPATISKLYYEQTRFPRHATIVKMMIYLGYELFAEAKR